jgi:acetyltransferase-like isoleucine patch superfamily enzyme
MLSTFIFRLSARMQKINYLLGAAVCRVFYGIEVGVGAHISLRLRIERNPGVAPDYFSIGANTKIKRDCFFGIRDGFLKIGKNVSINQGANFLIYGPVIIGDNTRIALNCTLVSFNHIIASDKKSVVERGNNFKGITIGKNVWIGANVTILDGVNISDNCVIGAGSVVSRDIEENTVAVGSPCSAIRSIT